jgi:hypothetical protein
VHVQRPAVVKIVTMREVCTTEEYRSLVHFLWPKGFSAKDIHKEMFPVYSGKCLSCKAVQNWDMKRGDVLLIMTDLKWRCRSE